MKLPGIGIFVALVNFALCFARPSRAADPSPAPAAVQPEEMTFPSEGNLSLVLQSEHPYFRMDTNKGIVFNLDWQAHGALCLANFWTQIPPVDKEKATFTLNYVDGTDRVEITQAGDARPVVTFNVPANLAIIHLFVRQGGNLHLFNLEKQGNNVAEVWSGYVRFRVQLHDAARYELCSQVHITLDGAAGEPSLDDLKAGALVKDPASIGDLVISGLDPAGHPFRHRYTVEPGEFSKKLDTALGELCSPWRTADGSPGKAPGGDGEPAVPPAASPAPSPSPAGASPAKTGSSEREEAARCVAQLASDSFAEREAATRRLRELGSWARGAVRKVLNSPDPEVRVRSRELWHTLRWLVVPGADGETLAIVNGSERPPPVFTTHLLAGEMRKFVDPANGEVATDQWTTFVKKHEALSLLLVAELKAAGKPANLYVSGLRAVLELVSPEEIAREIARSREPILPALLDELVPARVSQPHREPVVRIQCLLWKYARVFAFARESWIEQADDQLIEDCAIAVRRGEMAADVWAAAPAFVSGKEDPAERVRAVAFYVRLAAALHTPEECRPLLALAQGVDAEKAGEDALKLLVEPLVALHWTAEASELVRGATSADVIYLRAYVHAQAGEAEAAQADRQSALAIVDGSDPQQRKAICYGLGHLAMEMHDDGFAESVLRKAVEFQTGNAVYDANAEFRLADLCERTGRYAEAADMKERALLSEKACGGIVVGTRADGSTVSAGADLEAQLQSDIRALRARAAAPAGWLRNP